MFSQPQTPLAAALSLLPFVIVAVAALAIGFYLGRRRSTTRLRRTPPQFLDVKAFTMKVKQFPKKPILLLCIVAVVSILAVNHLSAQSVTIEYGDVTVDDAKQLMDSDPGLIIVDVRSLSEFEAEHILGAVNYCSTCDVNGFVANFAHLSPDDEILLYCRSGVRSADAMGRLTDHGYTNVFNMLGGINAWKDAGYAVASK